jgi:hypothetical protein
LDSRHFGRWVYALLNRHAGSTGTIPCGQMQNALAIGDLFARVSDGADDSVAKSILQDLNDEAETRGEKR